MQYCFFYCDYVLRKSNRADTIKCRVSVTKMTNFGSSELSLPHSNIYRTSRICRIPLELPAQETQEVATLVSFLFPAPTTVSPGEAQLAPGMCVCLCVSSLHPDLLSAPLFHDDANGA